MGNWCEISLFIRVIVITPFITGWGTICRKWRIFVYTLAVQQFPPENSFPVKVRGNICSTNGWSLYQTTSPICLFGEWKEHICWFLFWWNQGSFFSANKHVSFFPEIWRIAKIARHIWSRLDACFIRRVLGIYLSAFGGCVTSIFWSNER